MTPMLTKCKICQKPFVAKVHNNTLCSVACAKENARRRHKSLYYSQGMFDKTCAICGKTYKLHYKYRNKSPYCVKCGMQVATFGETMCPKCSKQFVKNKPYQKYCSKKCASGNHQSYRRHKCLTCGVEWTSKSHVCKYCRRCSANHRAMTRHAKIYHCVRCGKETSRHKKYCQTCHEYAVHRNSAKVKCPTCGKEFWRPISAIKRDEKTYCSSKCAPLCVQSDIGYRPDIGLYVRSRWEANFARILMCQNKNFKYELSFKLSNGQEYRPDFIVGDTVYEIKGRVTKRFSKVIMFRQEYPEYKHILIGSKRADRKGRYPILVDIFYEDLEQQWSSKINKSNKFIGWEDSNFNRHTRKEAFAIQLHLWEVRG